MVPLVSIRRIYLSTVCWGRVRWKKYIFFAVGAKLSLIMIVIREAENVKRLPSSNANCAFVFHLNRVTRPALYTHIHPAWRRLSLPRSNTISSFRKLSLSLSLPRQCSMIIIHSFEAKNFLINMKLIQPTTWKTVFFSRAKMRLSIFTQKNGRQALKSLYFSLAAVMRRVIMGKNGLEGPKWKRAIIISQGFPRRVD